MGGLGQAFNAHIFARTCPDQERIQKAWLGVRVGLGKGFDAPKAPSRNAEGVEGVGNGEEVGGGFPSPAD